MQIQKFDNWNNELNEFLGLKKLLGSMFSHISEPIRKRVEEISNSIDAKTGELKDARGLYDSIISTLKKIVDDKKADLKGLGEDDKDEVKEILTEFLLDVKAVFAAARVPYSSLMLESDSIDEIEKLNEDLKGDFRLVMTKATPEEFKKKLSDWIDQWMDSKRDDIQDRGLGSVASMFIDNLVDNFKKKIKAFGPERLKKLVELTNKNSNPSHEEVKQILKETPKPEDKKTADSKTEIPVKTIKGKKEFLNAIQNNLKSIAAIKKHNDQEDTYDITFKGIKL